ncbi:MAG: prepilin-type N-terminal cleavage/methylation domain-containing protein [Deltaproteobacteria bacterium]|nr:prepilin-type N-terminal cleavage/methylation domain-containing protein [Deltaproteobacteria bacterium]
MNRLRLRAEGGFTLIELLVVIAIIGILAAIAIPQFAAYRRRGFDSDAKSAAKNMATAQEAYFVDNNTYSATVSGLTARGFKQSTNIGIAAPSVSATTFIVSATVIQGCASGGSWLFTSSTGALTGTPCG